VPDFQHTLVILEILATILGLLSVYLLSVGNGRGWFIGMLMIVVSGAVFLGRSFHGSAALQLFFLVTQFVGWRNWRNGDQKDLRLSSRSLTKRQVAKLLGGGLVCWILLIPILQQTGGVSAWADGFATTGSILAQTLMVLRYRECWLVWLVVDVVYVGLMAQQTLYFFFLLYLVFCATAWNGWRQWTRDLEE
jgi:nicotinamide mononucleotide transporter